MREARVGVVVLTHERRDEVTRTVERMLALDEHAELVVVDNGSTDGTAAAVAGRWPGVRVVALDRNLGAAGRNAGVARVATPYVALCDDDTWWAPGALRRAADVLDAHPRLAVVSGRVLVGPDEVEDPTCGLMAASALVRDPTLPGSPILGFLAGASMIRRRAFLEAGGFDARFFLGGEEKVLAIDLAAAGWAMAYVDDVVVHHHPSARRDGDGRRRLLLRNALWLSWLRRPLPAALRATGRTLRTAGGLRVAGHACVDALAGLPWVLRHRRVVPPHVEAALRRLDPLE